MNVLVIDDDAMLCRVIVRSFDGLAAATGVSSSDNAWDALRHIHFDAVLCDTNLGVGQPTGQAVLAEIARRWPDARRFLMSGQPQVTCDTFFLKPLGLEELRLVAATDVRSLTP